MPRLSLDRLIKRCVLARAGRAVIDIGDFSSPLPPEVTPREGLGSIISAEYVHRRVKSFISTTPNHTGSADQKRKSSRQRWISETESKVTWKAKNQVAVLLST
jgi:hypothetical protein